MEGRRKTEIIFTRCGDSKAEHSVLLLVPEGQFRGKDVDAFAKKLSQEFKTFVLTSPLPSEDQVTSYTEQFGRTLLELGIKRATIFGIGAGASIAQATAVMLPRMVRRLVLLDATARLAPGFLTRFIDRVERFLPLGLPLRTLTKNFDSRPLLHRIYCPSLVLVSKKAGDYVKSQSTFISQKIPNAWFAVVGKPYTNRGSVLSDELCSLVSKFLQVPVKRPQKPNRVRGTGM